MLLVVGSMVSCRDGSSPAASPPPSTGQPATTTSTVAAPDAHLVVDDQRGVGRLAPRRSLDGLTVEGNELPSGRALVWVYGGLIDGAPGRASANELRSLAIGENDVGDAVVCRAVADESGSEGGRASDNRVDTSAC